MLACFKVNQIFLYLIMWLYLHSNKLPWFLEEDFLIRKPKKINPKTLSPDFWTTFSKETLMNLSQESCTRSLLLQIL